MSKRHLGQLLSPISKHLTGVRTAARVVSRTRGLRLLLDSSLRAGTQPTPDVYPFAAYLARVLGCRHVVAAGRPLPAGRWPGVSPARPGSRAARYISSFRRGRMKRPDKTC